MKLYSPRQVAVFSIVAAVLALGIAWALGFLSVPQSRDVGNINTAPAAAPPNGTPVQFDEVSTSLAAGGLAADERQNILIYQRYNEAVVNITSISFSYNWFLEPVPEEGTGSGAIFDPKGLILTNYHVIKGAKQLQVTMADGTDYEGRIVGIDPENDLAVVKIDPRGNSLVTIPFANSKDLLVGQKVYAIGNPFAFERTFTTGIVSGLGRPVRTNEGVVIREMIQTDASINPGNSGGPLLNSAGEMIGINTMIYSPSGGSIGIGFAVPVDTAKRVIPDLLNFGKVRRGWIDIDPVQLFPTLVRYGNLPVDRGILISEVQSGSLAESAGLRGGSPQRAVRTGRNIIYLGGDIIVEVDGTEVESLMDLYSALEDNKPGDTVEIRVVRGRREVTVSVELSERS